MTFKNFNFSDWALKNQQIMLFFILAILLLGGWAYLNLPRDEDPAFTIKTAIVSTQWAGANNDDMVNLVTNRLEKKIQELPDLEEVQSYTHEGQTTIFVNLKDSTPPKKVPELWQLLRNKIQDEQPNLPIGVQTPQVNNEFDNTYGTIYGFVADQGFSNLDIQDQIDQVKTEIQDIPYMGKMLVLGAQTPQITLQFSPQKIENLGLDLPTIIKAIQQQNDIVSIGDIRTSQDKIDLKVSGALRTKNDVENVILHIGQQFIALKDLFDITVEPSTPIQPSFHVNGKPAVGLAISMAQGGNLIKFGKQVNFKIQQIQQHLPVGIQVIKVADQSQVVNDSIHEFLQVLFEALLIVMAVSFVSLGLRPGLVVALAIPVVLALTFLGMYLFGIGLQRISLGALIIALGLLVDDAMITVETVISELEAGKPLSSAAITAFKNTAVSMLTGTLIMICGFIPVGFATSSAGEYCYSLFVVVFLALISSWFVAVLFTPLCSTWLLQSYRTKKEKKAVFNYLDFTLKHRGKVCIISLFILISSVFGTFYLKSEFFPISDRPELLVNLTLPENSSQEQTTKTLARIERLLSQNKKIDHYSSYIGSGAVRFYLPMDVLLENENTAQMVVVVKNIKERQQLQQWLQTQLTVLYPEVIARVSALELGPPVGWPIKYQVTGSDLNQVRSIASQISNTLHHQAEIKEVTLTSGEPKRSIQVRVNQIKAAEYGLTSAQITSQLTTIFSGQTITQLRNGKNLINLVIQANTDVRQQPQVLEQIKLTNTQGLKVPLKQFAQVEWGVETATIWRTQRLPFITVQADIDSNFNVAQVSELLSSKIDKIRQNLPEGYRIVEKGSVLEANKGNISIYKMIPVTILLILAILMVHLQNFIKVFQSIVIVPFALVGVVIVMLLTQTPLGFVALLGIIALSGMIIRNAVILIAEVERLVLNSKMTFIHAVKTATLHRSRPILLTACAAVLGMLPISQQEFWAPMAYAMMGGLITSTLFILILLPTVIVLTNDVKRYFKKV